MNDAQGRKPKISKLAIISLVLSILSLLIFPFGEKQYPLSINDLFIHIAGLLAACALILAFAAFIQIPLSARISVLVGFVCFILPPVTYIFCRTVVSGYTFWRTAAPVGFLGLISSSIVVVIILIRKDRVRGHFDKTESIVARRAIPILGVILACFCLYYWFDRTYIPVSTNLRWGRPCLTNFIEMGKAMRIYASDYNKYPEPNQWCDLLLKHGHVRLEHFVCPSLILTCPYTGRIILYRPLPKTGRCHFAMNPDCKLDSPRDVVLLFETKEGWNQFGGPELLAPENHEGRGCIILFNDGHVYFENVKSIPELNWGDEKGKK
jgi:hypothetical protein